MNKYDILALIEFDEGCFHDMQCHRYITNKPLHGQMRAAHERIESLGLIKLVGDEYFVTEDGREILGRTVAHAEKVKEEYLG